MPRGHFPGESKLCEGDNHDWPDSLGGLRDPCDPIVKTRNGEPGSWSSPSVDCPVVAKPEPGQNAPHTSTPIPSFAAAWQLTSSVVAENSAFFGF